MQRRVALVLVGLAACGGPQTQTEVAPPGPPPPGAITDVPERTAGQEMREHFWDVAEARDAVIAADIDAMRAPLLRIAEGHYGDDMPESWKSWIGDMQAEARAGSRVLKLHEAAQAVARLSGTCAECHRDTGAGPAPADQDWTPPPPPEGLSERMQHHMAASVALWQGLTAPHHAAWARGAKLLAELPLPTDEGTDMAQPLADIRELGQRAEEAVTNEDKVAAYGAVLEACGTCHSSRRPAK